MHVKDDPKPFWKYPLMGLTDRGALTWAQAGIMQKGINEEKACHSYVRNGSLHPDVTIQDVIKKLQQEMSAYSAFDGPGTSIYPARCLQHRFPQKKSHPESWVFANEESAIDIDYVSKDRELDVAVISLDEGYVRTVFDLLKKWMVRKPTKGRVFIVVSGSDGPYLHAMGMAGEDFIETNYRPEVVTEYKHIIADLNNPDPCGRIVILDGVPGCGKTHCVRAILNAVPQGTFVLIPSNMMGNLGSPSFIKALLREQVKGFPMILVVEDADEAISKRDRSNLSEISALLNFSDGIFGAVMDLRIITTTNADISDLDEAVMRDGRLCRRIEVGKLDADQATVVYKRLEGKGDVAKLFVAGKFYTLGQIYRLARGDGARPGVSKAKPTLGFVTPKNETALPMPSPRELGIEDGETASTTGGEFVVEGGEWKQLKDDEDDLEETPLDDFLDDEDDEDDEDEEDEEGLIDEDP